MRLRTMTPEEFRDLRDRVDADFAAEQVSAGAWDPEDAVALARAELDVLLPDGLATPGMLLISAEDDDGPIGLLWLSLTHPRGAAGTGWIYEIQVLPGRRRQGFGRQLLAEAERLAAEHGLDAIGLNVFATNPVAEELYRSSGYQRVTQQMVKRLP